MVVLGTELKCGLPLIQEITDCHKWEMENGKYPQLLGKVGKELEGKVIFFNMSLAENCE